jgi:hypothetical protein
MGRTRVAEATATRIGETSPQRDVWAVILVSAGILALGVGWLIGIYLLWTSRTWRITDKLLATFVVPGGVVGGLWLSFGLGVRTTTTTCVQQAGSSVSSAHCLSRFTTVVPTWLADLAVPFLILAPLVIAIRLLWVIGASRRG